MDETNQGLPPRPKTIQVQSMGAGSPRPETATEAIAQASNEVVQVVDARGRVITVGRLNALSYYRLTKVLKESANIKASVDIAVLATSVREINGEMIIFPKTEKELEFLIQRLDFDGLAAVGEALMTLTPTGDGEAEVAKNSAGDPALS